MPSVAATEVPRVQDAAEISFGGGVPDAVRAKDYPSLSAAEFIPGGDAQANAADAPSQAAAGAGGDAQANSTHAGDSKVVASTQENPPAEGKSTPDALKGDVAQVLAAADTKVRVDAQDGPAPEDQLQSAAATYGDGGAVCNESDERRLVQADRPTDEAASSEVQQKVSESADGSLGADAMESAEPVVEDLAPSQSEPAQSEVVSAPPLGPEPWEVLIERGEVRTDLSFHEAAASNEVKSLQWKFETSDGGDAFLDSKDGEKMTPLHVAAKSGAMSACEWLLLRKADLTLPGNMKASALHLAALEGHADVCRLLLDPSRLWTDRGEDCPHKDSADVGAVDLWRRTPLHKAAEGGNREVVALMIEHKAAANKSDREGDTPLHKAAAAGHETAIAELLRVRDINLDMPNSEGFSALDYCVVNRRVAAGDALVSAGARLSKDVRKKPPTLLSAAAAGLPFLCTYIHRHAPDRGSTSAQAQSSQVGEDGRTPMQLAVTEGLAEVVQRLVELRADVEAAGPNGLRPMHEAVAAGQVELAAILTERHADVGAVDTSGRTALFHAAASGHEPLCTWLLGRGLRASALDDCERIALHSAAEGGSVRVVEVLLEVDPAQLEEEDWQGWRPVHVAVGRGHADVCRLLVGRRADPHAPLDFGVTTLQMAAEGGHEAVLELLLANLAGESLISAVAARRTADGKTAWLAACAEGQLQCCRRLWDALGASGGGASVGEASDRDGRDALMLAARGGHAAVCEWLLQAGAVPLGLTTRDALQWTPLHVASAEGHRKMVQWLLAAKADPHAADAEGKTAKDWAKLRGHSGVTADLHGAEMAKPPEQA